MVLPLPARALVQASDRRGEDVAAADDLAARVVVALGFEARDQRRLAHDAPGMHAVLEPLRLHDAEVLVLEEARGQLLRRVAHQHVIRLGDRPQPLGHVDDQPRVRLAPVDPRFLDDGKEPGRDADTDLHSHAGDVGGGGDRLHQVEGHGHGRLGASSRASG